jgi:hypothetical protein
MCNFSVSQNFYKNIFLKERKWRNLRLQGVAMQLPLTASACCIAGIYNASQDLKPTRITDEDDKNKSRIGYFDVDWESTILGLIVVATVTRADIKILGQTLDQYKKYYLFNLL